MSSCRHLGGSLLALALLAGCTAEVAPDGAVAESADAVIVAPAPIGETLFASPTGLANCQNAELVTQVTTEHGLLPMYPVRAWHKATLASFYRACAGIPVPAIYMQGPTVFLERVSLGCGSFLYRGDLPGGGELEIFDHRTARRGFGCGTPSVNPVIVRQNGKLSYALNRGARCESLSTQAACESRSDCKASWVSLAVYPPRPPHLKCESRPIVGEGPMPVSEQDQ